MSTHISATVLKAFAALGLLSDRPDLSVAECASALGVPRATAHRLLASLREAGVVELSPAGQFRMSPRLFELGLRVVPCRSLIERAWRPLQWLSATTGLPSVISLRDHHEVLYVLTLMRGAGAAPSSPGDHRPLHVTATGKVLLAHSPKVILDEVVDRGLAAVTPQSITSPDRLIRELTQTRRTGFAVDQEEGEVGLLSVGVPVFGATGEVDAAMALCARVPHGQEVPAEVTERLRPPLLKAANGLSSQLRRAAAPVG